MEILVMSFEQSVISFFQLIIMAKIFAKCSWFESEDMPLQCFLKVMNNCFLFNSHLH